MWFNRDDSIEHKRIPHSAFYFCLNSSIVFDCPLSKFETNLEYSKEPQISFLVIFYIFSVFLNNTLQDKMYFAKLRHPQAFGRQVLGSDILIHCNLLPLPKLSPSLTGFNDISSVQMIHILPSDHCSRLLLLPLIWLDQALHQQFLTVVFLPLLVALNYTWISNLWSNSLLWYRHVLHDIFSSSPIS